jgi:hypothetical protein
VLCICCNQYRRANSPRIHMSSQPSSSGNHNPSPKQSSQSTTLSDRLTRMQAEFQRLKLEAKRPKLSAEERKHAEAKVAALRVCLNQVYGFSPPATSATAADKEAPATAVLYTYHGNTRASDMGALLACIQRLKDERRLSQDPLIAYEEIATDSGATYDPPVRIWWKILRLDHMPKRDIWISQDEHAADR